MNYGIANSSGQPGQEDIDQIVSYAIENGIRFFDTAQAYGNSESVIGISLEKLNQKNSVQIVSKLSPDLQECSADIIVKSVKSSVQKLNVKSLHGFLVHRAEALYSESYSLTVQMLKDEGLINKSGVSVYTPGEAITALDNPLVEILQIPFNILDRRWIDEGVLEKAEQKNVQLFFRSIFLQGLIFLNNYELKKRELNWAIPYLEQFNKLVSTTSLTAMELSFNILSNIPGDNIIIIGVENLAQLQKNIMCIEEVEQDKTVTTTWWSSIPVFPEKLLNPTLWN